MDEDTATLVAILKSRDSKIEELQKEIELMRSLYNEAANQLTLRAKESREEPQING